MKLLFPQNPMMRKLPDSIFEREYDAAQSLGFNCLLFAEEAIWHPWCRACLEALPDGDGAVSLPRLDSTEDEYRRFFDALSARGYRLVSTPQQYAEVTYFPNYYPKICEASPEAVWTDNDDPYLAWCASRRLGERAVLVCSRTTSSRRNTAGTRQFRPRGLARGFESVAEELRKEQGKVFNRGFVVKQYVPLRSRGAGPREYPQCEEYRLFFWQGELLIASHYHNQTANERIGRSSIAGEAVRCPVLLDGRRPNGKRYLADRRHARASVRRCHPVCPPPSFTVGCLKC